MDIQLKNITKSFENKTVFEDLGLTFTEGRINCLMGASGVGKTTLMNLLMDLEKPDSGQIQGIQGKRIAAVFQEDRLIEHWDAFKNIKLVCGKDISTERINQELSKVGLDDVKDKPVLDYSGGMRRRVALVRAILAESDLLILDEPFKGLDFELKKQITQYVKKNTQGKTVIVVTHDKEDFELLDADLVTLS